MREMEETVNISAFEEEKIVMENEIKSIQDHSYASSIHEKPFDTSSEPVKHNGHSSSVLESPKDRHSSEELKKYKGHSAIVPESPKDSPSSSGIITLRKSLINKEDFKSHVSENSKQNQSCHILRAKADRKQCKVSFTNNQNNQSQASSATMTQNSCKCNNCGKVFRYKRSLHLHERNHLYIKPFKCWPCRKLFSKKSDFTVHLRIHIDNDVKKDSASSVRDLKDESHATSDKLTENSCPCDICGKIFKLENCIPGHKRPASNLKTYKCLICKKSFTLKSSYNLHLKKHKTPSKRKTNIKSAKKSSSVNHDISQNSFACNNCGRLFRSQHYAIIHEKNHCRVICKKFEKKRKYDEHVKVNGNGGAGNHSVNASVDSSANNLNSHTNMKPYQGIISKKDSNNSSSLNLQIKVGINRSGKLGGPICSVCTMSFSSRGDLFEHLKSHRIHSCKLCRKQFMFKTDFILHMSTKHGKKELRESGLLENDIKKRKRDSHKSNEIDRNENKCDLCQKIFPDVGTLLKHNASAHVKGKFHQCNICQAVFPSKLSLARHYPVHARRGETASSSIGKDVATNQGNGAFVQQPLPSTNSNQCKSCKKSFQSPIKYLQHRIRHCKYERFTCHICKTISKSPYEFAKHMKSVHKTSKPYNCKKCDKSWVVYSSFENHNLIVHENLKLKFQCKFCDRSFVYRKSFIFHLENGHKLVSKQTIREKNILKNVMSKSVKKEINDNSNVNGNSAGEKKGLLLKQQSIDNDNSKVSSNTISSSNCKTETNEQNSKPPVVCNICKQDFANYYFMKKHITEVHEVYGKKLTRNKSNLVKKKNYYKCLICNRVFRAKCLYDYHILFCQKKGKMNFKVKETINNNDNSNKKAFKNRKRIVNIKKEPFACHICHRVFKHKVNLARHFTIHNRSSKLCLKNNEDKLRSRKLFRLRLKHCKPCGKTFSSYREYLGHLSKYCKYEPFECRSCKTSFVNPSEFGAHMRQVHKVSKPYKCHVCNLRCSLYTNLRNHEITHEKYQCSLCSKICSTMMHLNRHKNKVHRLNSNETSTKSNILENQELPSGEPLFKNDDAGLNINTISPFKSACAKCKLEFCRKHLYIKHVEICQNEESVDSVASSETNLTNDREKIEVEERSSQGRQCMEKIKSQEMENKEREGLEKENPEFHAYKSTEDLQEGMFVEDFGSRLPKIFCDMSHMCNLCNQRFKSYYYMIKHLKAVHGMVIKPVPCKKCNRLFSRKLYYNKHIKICQRLEENKTVEEIHRDANDELPGIKSPKEENFMDIDYHSIGNCDEMELSKDESFHESFSDSEDRISVDGVNSDFENSSLLSSSPREILKHDIEVVTAVESHERETVIGNATKTSGNGIDNCDITIQDVGFNVEESSKSTEKVSSNDLINEINICEKSSEGKLSKAMQVSHEDENWILKSSHDFTKKENVMEMHITEQKSEQCTPVDKVAITSPEKNVEAIDICSSEKDVHILFQSDGGSIEEFPVSIIPRKNENTIVKEGNANQPKLCPGISNSSKNYITQRKSSFGVDCSKYSSGLQLYKKGMEKKFLAMANNNQDVPHYVTVRNLKIAYASTYETNVIDVWMKY